MAKNTKSKGVSLAKGPVLIVGLAMIAFGLLALISGAHGFTTDAPTGPISGEKFLGLEVNGWSNLLFIGAGALLVFGSPLHWGAKSMSLLVGIGLIAAAVLAYLGDDSALGIFAANGLTELVWLAAGGLLLLLALLPRVGGAKKEDRADYDDRDKHGFSAKSVVERDRSARFDRDTASAEPAQGSRRAR